MSIKCPKCNQSGRSIQALEMEQTSNLNLAGSVGGLDMSSNGSIGAFGGYEDLSGTQQTRIAQIIAQAHPQPLAPEEDNRLLMVPFIIISDIVITGYDITKYHFSWVSFVLLGFMVLANIAVISMFKESNAKLSADRREIDRINNNLEKRLRRFENTRFCAHCGIFYREDNSEYVSLSSGSLDKFIND